jgi:hypothetical protein
MKKKFNQELLNEELKKFKMITEYGFFSEKQEEPTYEEIAEVDEEPSNDLEGDAENVSTDLGLDTPDDGGEAPEGEPAMGDEPEGEPAMGDEPAPEPPVEEPPVAPLPAPEPIDDGVEVDVTELVKGSEEAKKSADLAGHNTELLLQKLADLEARVGNMDKVTAKIDNLEKEIISRNPTPVEKLEMRSLSSYPYSQKLTDYWADKEGPYDVMGNEAKKEEYVLRQDDVDSSYSDSNIKKSFSVDQNDENEYEEEDY